MCWFTDVFAMLTAASQDIDADMPNSETESTREEQWGTGGQVRATLNIIVLKKRKLQELKMKNMRKNAAAATLPHATI